ncbi:MAG: M23 family metallopeptidase [Promethearchaeota archaeon]
MKKGMKLFISVLGIIIVGFAGFIFLYPQSPLYLLAEECPPIEFPMEGGALNITGFSGFNVSDWGEPGVTHNGIDLVVSPNNWTGILAVADGKVRKIEESENPYSHPPGMMMFSVYVTIARGWELKYVIEPFALTEQQKQLQRDNIYVVEGQEIAKNDRIARLLCTDSGYVHLHFMLTFKSSVVCAYTYSSLTAQAIYEDIATTYNKTICCPDAECPGC